MIFFDHVGSVGAGLGRRPVSPGLAASRYTMSCSSTNALPLAPDRVWRTVTKTIEPVDPDLASTDLISDLRDAVSPIRSGGPSNVKRLPAHMRRGNGMGGRKSPRSA